MHLIDYIILQIETPKESTKNLLERLNESAKCWIQDQVQKSVVFLLIVNGKSNIKLYIELFLQKHQKE